MMGEQTDRYINILELYHNYSELESVHSGASSGRPAGVSSCIGLKPDPSYMGTFVREYCMGTSCLCITLKSPRKCSLSMNLSKQKHGLTHFEYFWHEFVKLRGNSEMIRGTIVYKVFSLTRIQKSSCIFVRKMVFSTGSL